MVRRISSNPTRANKTTHSALVAWDLLISESHVPIVGQIGDTDDDSYKSDAEGERRQEWVLAGLTGTP